MKIPDIPFNDFIGLKKSDREGYIMQLESGDIYHNHLGTVHASALFALAEASSGEFLLRDFTEAEINVIPVVRKVAVKYSRPVRGPVWSKAGYRDTDRNKIELELKTKNRSLFTIIVELTDGNGNKVMTADIEWFVSTMVRNDK